MDRRYEKKMLKINLLKINYKGYVISQSSNNHVAICKDDKMLFHAQVNKKLDKDELKKQLDFYLGLAEKIEEE